MAKWGKGKTLLSVVDTTASFIHLGLDACILNTKKIGLAYGYCAVEASWVVDGLGGQAWEGSERRSINSIRRLFEAAAVAR